MTERLNDLFKKYHVEKTRDFKFFVSDLEPDIDILMTSSLSDYNDYSRATQLIADFGIQLNNQGYVKRGKLYIDKAIQNLENDAILKGSNLLKNELYSYLIWTRGQINYSLKKYVLASKDFRVLSQEYPDNDRYKNWYNGSVILIPNQLQWGFIALLLLVLLTKYIIGYKSDWMYYLQIIGLIGLIGSWIYKKQIMIK